MGDKHRGLYAKFRVARNDGSDQPGWQVMETKPMGGGQADRLVGRLRDGRPSSIDCEEAAHEIEQLQRERDSKQARIDELRDEREKLREALAIFVHAHHNGNSVPPHIEAEAKKLLTPNTR